MMRTWLRRARRARGDDSGFTLPELIVSIVILSFIMGAIGLTMIVVLKNTRSSTERITAGGSAQTLSLWFPGDVQSTRGRGAYTGAGATGCGDDQGSTNVITVQRSDVLRSPGDLVSYRLKQQGPGDYELWRVACTGGAWSKRVVVQGIADPATVQVSALLEGDTTPVAVLTPGDVFTQLGLQVAVGAGDAIPLAVSGTPRSPGLVVPCQLISATPQTVQRIDGGRLTEPAAFTVNTAGDCADLSVTVEPDDIGAAVPLAPGPNTWTGTAPDVAWSIGAHEGVVRSGGAEVGRFPLDVLPEPCEIVALDRDVLRIGLDGLPTSPTGETYTLATTTSCNVTRLETDMGDANLLTLTPTRVAPGRFRFTVRHDDGPWIAEPHPIRVFDGATVLGTVNFLATLSNCAAAGLTRVVLVTTGGVLRNTTGPNPPTLDVDIGATRCLTPVRAQGNNGLDLELNRNPPPLDRQWSQFLAPYPATWTPQTTVTITVTSDGITAGTFPVLVDDCALVDQGVQQIQTRSQRVDNDELTFRTDNRCSFTPIVRFTDRDGQVRTFTAERAGGAGGQLQDWRVDKDLLDGIPWDNELVTVSVYDDAQPTANGFVGTFDAQGVPQ